MQYTIFFWGLAIIVALIGGLFSFVNWRIFYLGRIKKQKTPSGIPILGGLLLAYSFYLIPNNPYHHLFWLAAFLDIGCVPNIIWLIYILVRHIFSKEKSK